MFTFKLSNFFGNSGENWLHINDVINWQLSKQYHPPYRGLRCPPIEVEYFFEVILWQVTSFQMFAGQVYFLKYSYEICCVHVTMAPSYQDFDFKLTSDARLVRSRDGHTLRPILNTLKLVHFDSWNWQSFVSTCDIFLTVLFHWMCKMKFSYYQESSVIHARLVCLSIF